MNWKNGRQAGKMRPGPSDLLKVGERDKETGLYLVYIGGTHRIFCNGAPDGTGRHFQMNDDRTIPYWSGPDQKCMDWTGMCPAVLASRSST